MIKRELRTSPSLSPKNILVRNYCMRDITTRMPVLAGNFQRATSPAVPKTVDTRPIQSPPARTNPLDIVIFCGACGIALGWFLVIAMISFEVGGLTALAGISTVLLGMAAKFGLSTWRRLTRKSAVSR